MGTSRIIPQSIIGRLKALDVAKTKKDGIVAPAVNILSPATSARLDLDYAAYKGGVDAITATKAAYHAAITLAIPQRLLLKTYISSFYNSLNNAIIIGTIPAAARAYYGLNISNRRMPTMNSDTDLLPLLVFFTNNLFKPFLFFTSNMKFHFIDVGEEHQHRRKSCSTKLTVS